MIYLDNAATTQYLPEVFDAMMNAPFGNPGSLHSVGREARYAIDKARVAIARTINAKSEQIIFTASATEANNIVIKSAIENGFKIITTPIEHKSILNPVSKCDKELYTFYAIDEDELIGKASYVEGNKLVSVMGVNNEIGNRFDINRIGNECRRIGALFHVDASQAYGKFKIDVERDCIDMMTIAGHKIHGPKGIGVLYVRDRSMINKQVLGGGQEFGYRAGTENVAGIVGFGKAAEIACGDLSDEFYSKKAEHMHALTSTFLEEVTKVGGLHVNGNPDKASGIINLRFDGVNGETLVLLLSTMGVMISAGSACNENDSTPSYVLKVIGLTDSETRCSVRFSFCATNSIDEAIRSAKIVRQAVDALREI